jgi:hypothetical protein
MVMVEISAIKSVIGMLILQNWWLWSVSPGMDTPWARADSVTAPGTDPCRALHACPVAAIRLQGICRLSWSPKTGQVAKRDSRP